MPGFRSTHFGIGVGSGAFRFHSNIGRTYGFRPYYVSYPTFYPAYFGGFYPYNTSVYLQYYPSYSSMYPIEPRTIYIYPPPEIRYYGESAPQTPPPARDKEAMLPPLPHPYDDPVAPSPEKGSLDEALTHIRVAWLREDLDQLSMHLPKSDIQLYHDGELRRELSPDEFMRLTREAIRETRTLNFRYTEVRRPAADEATALAIHTYVEEGAPLRDSQTVTLRYDLVKRDNVWVLRAVYVNPDAPRPAPKP
jgi:hypothetical protein